VGFALPSSLLRDMSFFKLGPLPLDLLRLATSPPPRNLHIGLGLRLSSQQPQLSNHLGEVRSNIRGGMARCPENRPKILTLGDISELFDALTGVSDAKHIAFPHHHRQREVYLRGRFGNGHFLNRRQLGLQCFLLLFVSHELRHSEITIMGSEYRASFINSRRTSAASAPSPAVTKT
jgi:hypothetical protein